MDKSRIEGALTYLVAFGTEHLHNSRYISWLHDYHVIKTLYLPSYVENPVSIDELTEYYERVSQSERDLFFALYAKGNDEFIGTVKIAKIDWENSIADVGIMIGDRNYWGMGMATDSVRAISKYLFEELSMRKLTCGLMEINPAMLKVFQKNGFIVEGVFRKTDFFEGEYYDHIYMGCFTDEFKAQ